MASLRPVAEVLGALRAAPGPAELSGEELAMAQFRKAANPGGQRRRRVASHRARSRRRGLPGLVFAPWVAAAAFLVVLAVGGVAAYTGRLPTPIQSLAHVVIAAPPAHHATRHRPPPHPAANRTEHRSTDPVTHPTAAANPGHEFSRFCQALLQAALPGHPGQETGALRHLIEAAGGADQALNYCRTITGQDASAGPRKGEGQDNGNADGHMPPSQDGPPPAPGGQGPANPGSNGQGAARQSANGQNSAG